MSAMLSPPESRGYRGAPMKTRTATAALAFVLPAVTLVLGQTADPWIGTWKTNTAKSTFSAGLTPTVAMTLTIESAPGGAIKVVTDYTNAQGQPTHTEIIGAFDGKYHPVKGSHVPSATNAFKRIGGRTFEMQGKADGKVTVTTRAVVSADGKTMTWTQTGQTITSQPVKNTIVLEKQ